MINLKKISTKKNEQNGEKSQLKRTINQDQQNEKDNQYLSLFYLHVPDLKIILSYLNIALF